MKTALDQISQVLQPFYPRTVSIRFDNILVFQWVDGQPQSFTGGLHSHYIPQVIEIWMDNKPVYGLHPPTRRVYLNQLPFVDRAAISLEPKVVAQLAENLLQFLDGSEKSEF